MRDQRPRGRWWYHRWPDVAVDNPRLFGTLWRHTTDSFLATADALGALLVPYEQLTTGGATESLAAHTRVDIPPEVLDVRVGGSHQKAEVIGLSIHELRDLREEVEPTASALGYGGPSDG